MVQCRIVHGYPAISHTQEMITDVINTSDMTPNDTDLLFLLHDFARLLRVEADKRARCHGMTRAQWSILIRLDLAPGLSQKELAEVMEVEPITVARLVDRLAARGMVERRPDPADRRIWRLHLLPAAQPVLAEINIQRDEMLGVVADGIPAAAMQMTREVLLQMKANLAADRPAPRRADSRLGHGMHFATSEVA
jgi:DNA-binding MarR family transcriptional regulator